MKYVSRLSEMERSYLSALRGRSMLSLATDGWAVELATRHGALRFEPCQMRTPDADHPIACVSRPQVVAMAAPSESETLREVGRDLGPIEGVWIHSTVVTFSKPKKVPKTKLEGGVIPAGISYEPGFRRPAARQGADDDDGKGAFVDLDVAVEIRSATHETLVFTNGTGLFVSLRLDGRPAPGWEKRGRPIREVERVAIAPEESEGRWV
jgi:hypothetical protein